MSSCGLCVKVISGKQLKLGCTDCAREFHGSCLKMSKADIDCVTTDGLVWRCQPCSETRRKSLRFESAAEEGKVTLEDILKKINEIAGNQKSCEANFNKSFESLTEQLTDNTAAVKSQNDSLEKCLKIIDDLVIENKNLNKKILSLENRVEELEQYSRTNAVEIHGVPFQNNEDVLSVVKEVGKALDMNITDTMIDACHRLGRKPGPNNSSPGIIVKFVRRLDKEELLKKRRVKSNLSTRHMNLGLDQPVYINESLSPMRRRLFVAARQMKRDKGYRFLWVRGGKILVRKEESAPVIQVACQADLEKM